MKRSIIAAGLAAVLAVSATGCAANESTNTFKGTDIGGIGKTNGAEKAEGGLFGGIKDIIGDGVKSAMDIAYGADFAEADAAMEAVAPTAAIAPEPGTHVEIENGIEPQSGLLTGGEWNDNDHREDWKALYESNSHWNGYKDAWRVKAQHRLTVKVQNEKGEPLEGAKVSVSNWMNAVTDNTGTAYLFGEGAPGGIKVTCEGADDVGINYRWSNADDWKSPNMRDMSETVTMPGGVSHTAKKLDLMIMCDTTGSMSDELEYLKVELEDIVKTIKKNNANIPTRISVNFYRDTEDEYEVRSFPFSENINEVANAIKEQSAEGGGDFPEAVHTALKNAVDGHEWNEDSVKIMFLVLDAPPHSEDQIVDEVNKYVGKAAEMGIRIIPIASSGIDKSTEYLLRVMAQTTGGTYTFLTDDSGIGGEHLEATVGAYNVEKLNDMMVRIVNGYLK